VAKPGPMPVDKPAWLARLHASNFMNAWHQYDDLVTHTRGRRVLVIGPGQGLEAAVLRSQNYQVTTYDIDPDFQPDVVGSAHDLRVFADGQFDAVVASHVLEHMAFGYFERALAEIGRVGRFALVYLPYAGRHWDLGVIRRQHLAEHHLRLNVPPFWRVPSATEARFAGGQHYWEVGIRGCSRRAITAIVARHFRILRAYQNPHWLVSWNYVLAGPSAP